MGKLVEATHVSLGGEISALDVWAQPYLDDEHAHYASTLIQAADALLLGRRTYEGLSAAYTRMADDAAPGSPGAFVERMNAIAKHVASSTLRELTWNASLLGPDAAQAVAGLKAGGVNLLKYGTGPLDATLMRHGLVDEFHLFLTPVAYGRGQHLFEDIDWAPHLRLADVTRFASGVLVLVYLPG